MAELTPGEQTIEKGNPVEFNCTVTKDDLATPVLTWFLNGNQIIPDKKGSEFTMRGKDTLHVVAAKSSHSGVFKCVATTDYDSAFSEAQLIVQAEPDPPYNVEVSIVGLEGTLSWTEPSNNNAEIRTYRIEWRTQHGSFPDPSEPNLAPWDLYKEVSASSTEETIELGNHLMYSFRVIATNDVGDSRRSDEAQGEMTPSAPPSEDSMPGNVQGEATEPGKLRVTWDEVHPYYHNAPDFAYVVRWKRPGETNWTTQVITDPTQTEFVIEGDEYENIEFEVGVQNAEDSGPEPDRFTEFTGQGRPSASPQNVEITAMGPNSINVTWDPVPEGDINGPLVGYNIYYTMQAGQGTERVQKCEGEENFCIVAGLEAFTTYEVSVAVVNEAQAGPRSDVVTIKTEEGVPTMPENLEVKSTSYRVAVSWQPPAKENGVHRGYNLALVSSQGDEVVNKQSKTLDASKMTYELKNANPDTTYEVTLTAFTNAGDGDPAIGSSTTGVAGAPPVPGKPELADDPAEKHLNVTWPPVGEDDPKPDEVRACYKIAGEEEEECEWTDWVDVLDDDKITIDTLNSGTKYEVFLEHKNKEGSETGPAEVFTTQGKGPATGGGGTLQPWFIVIICIIFILLLILLIICILKTQKGGKYNVSDKEKQLNDENAPLNKNDGFPEFNNDSEFPDDMEGSQDSLASNPDDDGDSLKEYADDEDPSKFNEEGSFIEEYHDPKPRSTDVREGGTSTFV